MNKKSIIAVLLIILLAAVSILGLPLVAHRIERQAESVMPTVTTTPLSDDDLDSMEYGEVLQFTT